jgi:carboxylesterase type B
VEQLLSPTFVQPFLNLAMASTTSGTATNTFVFEHPTLGYLTGAVPSETPDVVRFRAIPYARHPGRFKHSILREDLDGHSRDFTKPGYACPHKFDGTDIHGGGPLPGEELIQTSESESLILDVNVPRSHLESVQKGTAHCLPVLSYIHGGAFVLGKIDAAHDTSHMAQHSVDIGKPVITTGIQYRLGALGFLVTPGGEKNFGLWDQRNAMLWTQKFIEGFGGDNGRITMFGESAGGYSICCHMLSHLPPAGPLFNRAIIMSGVPGPMLCPLAEEDAKEAFDIICEGSGIKERGEAALEKLRALDVETFYTAGDAWTAKGNRWHPVQDEAFFNVKVTWDQTPELLASCDWVNELIVGNVGFEGVAYPSVADLMSPSIFQDHMRLTQSEEATLKVMKAYKIDLSMDQNLFLTSAMRWLGDMFFDGTSDIPTCNMPDTY